MNMLIERILEGALFAIALRTGLRLLSQPGEEAPALVRRLGRQRLPIAAIIITAVLIAGCVLELAWPGALDALRQQPSGAWWQTFTAPFVQEGVAGALFNVITAAVVLVMAEWQWGRLTAAAIWLIGAWAPVGDVAQLTGYKVSAANVAAYSAGSSGATYFTAATLCAALLCTAAGRTRLLGLVAPAIAAVMWIFTNDGHGVLFIEGFVLGLLIWAGRRALHISGPFAGPEPAGPGTQPPAPHQLMTAAGRTA
jgi:membrane associated rhomboid family serine protease